MIERQHDPPARRVGQVGVARTACHHTNRRIITLEVRAWRLARAWRRRPPGIDRGCELIGGGEAPNFECFRYFAGVEGLAGASSIAPDRCVGALNRMGGLVHATRMVIAGMICALGVIAGAISATAAPVSVGHSGWTWGDPSPQGNDLNNVTFAGARGFAVGEFGTVLRSDDGGNSWIGLPTGTRSSLSLVQEVDPNTVVVGGECTVRESVNGGESFQRLPVNESEYGCATRVAALSFLTPGTGYVEQADGTILLTNDGGQTLQPKTPAPLNGATAATLDFTSATTGFAVTGGKAGGRILRTTDGADSLAPGASSPPPLAGLTVLSP